MNTKTNIATVATLIAFPKTDDPPTVKIVGKPVFQRSGGFFWSSSVAMTVTAQTA